MASSISLEVPTLVEVKAEIARMMGHDNFDDVVAEAHSGMIAQQAHDADYDKLIRYCMLVNPQDVPPEILPPIKLMTGLLLDGDKVKLNTTSVADATASYNMMETLCMNLVTYLLRGPYDSPDKALEAIEKQVFEHRNFLRFLDSEYLDNPWMQNPRLYSRYGDVLILAKRFTEHTRTVLENVLDAVRHPQNASRTDINIARYTALAHTHLALVLQQLGTDKAAQKEHTEYAAKFFRKSRLMMRDDAHRFLLRQDGLVHPVFLALGSAWFTERPSARDDRNSGRYCQGCMKSGINIKLSACSRCRETYYCSTQCQRADWKSHKPLCQNNIEEKDRQQDLKKSDPRAASQVADILRWKNGTHYANFEAMIHALNLQRDPTRGQTHVVVRKLAHVTGPNIPKDFRFRVQVTECSVYRIDDILSFIKGPASKDSNANVRASMKAVVDDLIKRSNNQIPILEYTVGPGISPCVSALSVPIAYVRSLPYDPNWREVINGEAGTPPGRFVVPNGALDAEFRF